MEAIKLPPQVQRLVASTVQLHPEIAERGQSMGGGQLGSVEEVGGRTSFTRGFVGRGGAEQNVCV